VKEERNLRADLERVASNAGDPPERGLERVAARRHRRLRRRRGAVVTAAALAVLLGVVWLTRDQGEDGSDVAVSPAGRPARTAAQLPSVVMVRCTAQGIDIPVASVRPQQDGLHVRVLNELPMATELSVRNGDWSARETFRPGGWDLVVPAPPGRLTLGCSRGAGHRSLTVDLVDVHGYYQEPELECPAGDTTATLTDLQPVEPDRTMTAATNRALEANGLPSGLVPGPPRGYINERLSDALVQPRVQVSRDGDRIGFATLQRTDNPDLPWRVAAIVACESVLAERAAPGTTTTTA
jgi:hypothetical protein